jgi:hypothetical protein
MRTLLYSLYTDPVGTVQDKCTRRNAFVTGLATATLGLVIATLANASVAALLVVLAIGLTVMLGTVVVRRSTLAVAGSRFRRFLLSGYALTATAVALVWAGAFGNGTTVLTALLAGVAASIATFLTIALPVRQKVQVPVYVKAYVE